MIETFIFESLKGVKLLKILRKIRIYNKHFKSFFLLINQKISSDGIFEYDKSNMLTFLIQL